ncbi:hypothetical protein GCM10007857_72730 [Bradyrhizobium iriomotense]|uniref:Uncharacterized protein n=1 Tax=Bradyrhizobium iriomotense TaxID=441950 RepID=A0ABQ6B9V7_9BRAD|nr:hypothetical protein GCM10007857_72730 [Bradyrhizobium iriomotense]
MRALPGLAALALELGLAASVVAASVLAASARVASVLAAQGLRALLMETAALAWLA